MFMYDSVVVVVWIGILLGLGLMVIVNIDVKINELMSQRKRECVSRSLLMTRDDEITCEV